MALSSMNFFSYFNDDGIDFTECSTITATVSRKFIRNNKKSIKCIIVKKIIWLLKNRKWADTRQKRKEFKRIFG